VKRIALAEFGDDVRTELAVQRECSHECIVNFVCSYCWQGDLWIVMECVDPSSVPQRESVTLWRRYCSGGSLNDILSALEEPLTDEEIAWVCLCCARGLAYMHSQRKIHRDIKVPPLTCNNFSMIFESPPRCNNISLLSNHPPVVTICLVLRTPRHLASPITCSAPTSWSPPTATSSSLTSA
jgi:serine/threonine protein kinase